MNGHRLRVWVGRDGIVFSSVYSVQFKIRNNSLGSGNNKQGKGKVVPVCPMQAHRGNESVTLLMLKLRARWKVLVQITPRPLASEKKNQYSLFRRLGGSQSRFGR